MKTTETKAEDIRRQHSDSLGGWPLRFLGSFGDLQITNKMLSDRRMRRKSWELGVGRHELDGDCVKSFAPTFLFNFYLSFYPLANWSNTSIGCSICHLDLERIPIHLLLDSTLVTEPFFHSIDRYLCSQHVLSVHLCACMLCN